MHNIEARIPEEYLNIIRFVLVCIDPKLATPTRLKAFAKENFMDDEEWSFLRGSESDFPMLANLLTVKHKQISPMDF